MTLTCRPRVDKAPWGASSDAVGGGTHGISYPQEVPVQHRTAGTAPTTRRAITPALALSLLLTGLALFPDAGAVVAGDAPAAAADGVALRGVAACSVDYRPVIAALRREIPGVLRDTGAVGLIVALVDGQRVVWTQGFGDADRESGRAMTANTLLHIGSTTKTLTAIAVMQLVERGLVELDRPLADYIPSFSLLPRFRDSVITVRTVLDHHSGIPGDVYNGLITTGHPTPGYRAWLLRALRGMYPEHPVNTVLAYSNAGYVLLQSLVEHVSGMPFERYAQEHLFGPLGMTSSTFDDRRPSARRLAANYQVMRDDSGVITAVQRRPREYVNGWTAGSIVSSAHDMARYLKALLTDGQGHHGRILRPGTLQAMWEVQASPPLDLGFFDYGLGFIVDDLSMAWAGTAIGHDGATVWNHSMLQLLPQSELGVFVSVNTATGASPADDVAVRALSLAFTAKTGVGPPQPPALDSSPPAFLDPADQARIDGSYAGTGTLATAEASRAGVTWTTGVDTGNPSATDFRASLDGWLRPAADPATAPQVRFTTVAGRRLALARIPLDAALATVIMGDRIPVRGVPAPWRTRLGTYAATTADPAVDPSLQSSTITLAELGGILLLQPSSYPGVRVLQPGPGGSLVTYGLGLKLGRGEGDALIPATTPSGRPSFTFMGVRYVRTAP